MEFGSLRHRVTIQASAETPDGRGGHVAAAPTTVFARVPACVTMLDGRELERAIQIDPRSRLKVSLRYHAGLKAGQFIVYHSFAGDRTLEVIAPPLIDEQDRSVTLLCGEAPA